MLTQEIINFSRIFSLTLLTHGYNVSRGRVSNLFWFFPFLKTRMVGIDHVVFSLGFGGFDVHFVKVDFFRNFVVLLFKEVTHGIRER